MACRKNGSVGYAVDGFMVEKKFSNDTSVDEPAEIFTDRGLSSWFSKYFVSFGEASVARFYPRTPEGSAGDVKAKGTWESGLWTVEFCRKLDTGYPDDMKLSVKSNAHLSIFTVVPAKADLRHSSFTAVSEVEAK